MVLVDLPLGIWRFNPNIFGDENFAPSNATDARRSENAPLRPQENSSEQPTSRPHSSVTPQVVAAAGSSHACSNTMENHQIRQQVSC